MKLFIALLALVSASTSFASSTSSSNATLVSRYDQLVESCLVYAPTPVSEEDVKACKRNARSILLADQKAFEAYLYCVDYEHLPVSDAQKEECLRQL